MIRVRLPTHLCDYTGGRAEACFELEDGATLGDLLAAIDEQWRGLRFRIVDEQDGIRRHIKFFVEGEQVHSLATCLPPEADVMIVAALSGG